MKNQINNELMEVLNIFQQAYIQRDTKEIDNFMDALFDKNENVIIVGTGGHELCIGYEDVKDIFIGDFEYWGDLRINADDSTIIPLGNTALIYTTGTVKYSFDSKSETYTRYLGSIKKYFDGVSLNSKKSNNVKLTEINWTLSHLLSQRDNLERSYLWDLRVSFVLIKKETRWIIKQMQFSLPVVGHMPDIRINNSGNHDLNNFNNETKKMKEFSVNNTRRYNDEIVLLIKDFNKQYLDMNIDINKIANKYFAVNNPLIVNTDKYTYCNQKEIIKLIENHRMCYDEMTLDYENCLINSNEDVVWVVSHGTMKKVISESSSFVNAINTIENIFTTDLKDKDKLFNIRRIIAGTFKENAKGEEYIWPFRFEAVIIREKDNWVFKYLQFSLPFDWSLEGKTDSASILEKNI
ncbi:nuclear transport factor 2 family protein [Clostridium sp.]|uniref:nuclear transport factor 2 family protein n=1 Tax=Clostridium sp. TaxID=1506 RepID=UPI003D6CF1D8